MNKRSGTESKKKILHAALKVFSNRGFAGASIRDIAKAAGISVGGVYLYFKNKEDLYFNLIGSRIDELRKKTEEIATSNRPAKEILSDFISIHLDYVLRHKELILIHIREHCFAFSMDKKRQFFRNQRHLLERIIAQGVKGGEFRKCNIREVSNIMMGTLRGSSMAMVLDENVIITAKGVTELILHGLLSDRNKLRRKNFRGN